MVSVISFYNYLEENLVCSKLIGSPDYLTFVPFLNSLVPNYQSGMLAKTTEALLSYCSTFQCFEVKNDVELIVFHRQVIVSMGFWSLRGHASLYLSKNESTVKFFLM